MSERANKHHVLETRSDWTSNPDAKKLRQTHELIPLVDYDAHVELTRDCPCVPLLGRKTLEVVRADFHPRGGTLTSIDLLLCAINKSMERPHIHNLENALAQLAMDAIEWQIPYLKGNIIE